MENLAENLPVFISVFTAVVAALSALATFLWKMEKYRIDRLAENLDLKVCGMKQGQEGKVLALNQRLEQMEKDVDECVTKSECTSRTDYVDKYLALLEGKITTDESLRSLISRLSKAE